LFANNFNIERRKMNFLDKFPLEKENHLKYFNYHIKKLTHHYQGQDTNRITLLYFCVSGLDILNALDTITNKEEIIKWVYSLQIVPNNEEEEKFSENSGFTGGNINIIRIIRWLLWKFRKK
jgi:hypothetical protein